MYISWKAGPPPPHVQLPTRSKVHKSGLPSLCLGKFLFLSGLGSEFTLGCQGRNKFVLDKLQWRWKYLIFTLEILIFSYYIKPSNFILKSEGLDSVWDPKQNGRYPISWFFPLNSNKLLDFKFWKLCLVTYVISYCFECYCIHNPYILINLSNPFCRFDRNVHLLSLQCRPQSAIGVHV